MTDRELKDDISKVPAATRGFRIIKILATNFGETGGDTVTMSEQDLDRAKISTCSIAAPIPCRLELLAVSGPSAFGRSPVQTAIHQNLDGGLRLWTQA